MTDVDLSKVIFDSRRPAFMNNNIYTGSFVIAGSWAPGYQAVTHTVTLDEIPDIVVATYQAPTDWLGTDPRPDTVWFKEGYAWVRGDNSGAGYNNYPIPYQLYTVINGTTATITCSTVNQTATTLTLTPTTVYYRIIDYSVL